MKKSLEVLEKVKEYLTEEDYNSMEFDLLCEALADKFKEEFSVSLKYVALPQSDISSRLHKLLLLQDIIYAFENHSDSIALNATELKALLDNMYSWVHINEFFSRLDEDRMCNVLLAIESAGRKMAEKND